MRRTTPALSPLVQAWAAHELLDAQGERAAARAIAATRKAGGPRHRAAISVLVRSHVRLAVRLAGRHVGRGVDLEDLVQEALIALASAAARFDPDLGGFAHYAAWWIEARIGVAVATSTIVRVPPHVRHARAKARRAIARFETLEGRAPTAEELLALGVDEEALSAADGAIRRPASLDAPARPGDGAELHELLADERVVSPDVGAEQAELRDRILPALLATLSARERVTLERHFAGGKESLAEVGEAFGVSREAIRLSELHALERLRKAMRRRELTAAVHP